MASVRPTQTGQPSSVERGAARKPEVFTFDSAAAQLRRLDIKPQNYKSTDLTITIETSVAKGDPKRRFIKIQRIEGSFGKPPTQQEWLIASSRDGVMVGAARRTANGWDVVARRTKSGNRSQIDTEAAFILDSVARNDGLRGLLVDKTEEIPAEQRKRRGQTTRRVSVHLAWTIQKVEVQGQPTQYKPVGSPTEMKPAAKGQKGPTETKGKDVIASPTKQKQKEAKSKDDVTTRNTLTAAAKRQLGTIETTLTDTLRTDTRPSILLVDEKETGTQIVAVRRAKEIKQGKNQFTVYYYELQRTSAAVAGGKDGKTPVVNQKVAAEYPGNWRAVNNGQAGVIMVKPVEASDFVPRSFRANDAYARLGVLAGRMQRLSAAVDTLFDQSVERAATPTRK